MTRRRQVVVGLMGLGLLVLAKVSGGSAPAVGDSGEAAEASGPAPAFQVDPFWPKPLPNNWLMGQASGVAVDRRDHVWVIQPSTRDP
jgi:hypothetical protein